MRIIRTHGFHAEDATARVGFSLHVADVYVAELMRAAERRPEAALSHGTCVRLLRPWIAVAQATQQPALLARIKCGPVGACTRVACGICHTACLRSFCFFFADCRVQSGQSVRA